MNHSLPNLGTRPIIVEGAGTGLSAPAADIQRTLTGDRSMLRSLLSVLVIVWAFFAWFLNLFDHQNWIPALVYILGWLRSPVIYFSPFQVEGVVPAALATILIWLVGTLAGRAILGDEPDRGLLRVASVAFGLGLTGLVVVALGSIGLLDGIHLDLSVVLLLIILILIVGLKDGRSLSSFTKNLQAAFRTWQIGRPRVNPAAISLMLLFGVVFGAIYYHAIVTPVLQWDALIYHATVAKLMFYNHGVPLIAGTSVGIQLSGNYPPLYPALGAFYYVQVGSVQDLYLRLVSPTISLLTVLVTYKIGQTLGGRITGVVAAVLLALSPLLILTSIFAINYMTTTFFCALSFLFLVKGLTETGTRYFIAAGIAYGLAMLTAYQALFFLPAFVFVILLSLIRSGRDERKALLWNLVRGALFVPGICGVWYLRNLILLGDPIFPFGYKFLQDRFMDAAMLERTIAGVKADGIYVFYGKSHPSVIDILNPLLANKSHFPAFTIVTLLALFLIVFQKRRWLWVSCAAFAVTPILMVVGGVTWIYPRYFVMPLPYLALLSSLPLTEALRIDSTLNGEKFLTRTRWIQGGMLSLLILTLVFPTSLALFGGQSYDDADWSTPSSSYLDLFTHPNDMQPALAEYYGVDAEAWNWLNVHLNGKVGTFENRIYYLKDAQNDYIFYFDGYEARSLYQMNDPVEMVKFLRQSGVTVILDPSWIRHWDMYRQLPLDKYLGDPNFFPLIHGERDSVAIYAVGRLDDPLTVHSPLGVSTNLVVTNSQVVSGRVTKAIPAKSTSVRVYVETPKSATEVWVEMEYLDKGQGALDVNLNLPGGWYHGLANLDLADTGTWQTFRFSMPVNRDSGFAELGLYKNTADLIVSSIIAYPAQP